jgi:hypothetical protein
MHISKIYNWSKFNEDISPVTAHQTAMGLKDKGHTHRSHRLLSGYIMNFFKRLAHEQGAHISDNVYLTDLIVLGDQKIVYIYPILITFSQYYMEPSIPFSIMINDSKISINTDPNISKIDWILRDTLIDRFFASNIDDIYDEISIDIDDETEMDKINDYIQMDKINDYIHTTVNNIFTNTLKKSNPIYLNRGDSRKVINAMKSNSDITEAAFKSVKTLINSKKMDTSLGEVEEFIQNLKVNDVYRD